MPQSSVQQIDQVVTEVFAVMLNLPCLAEPCDGIAVSGTSFLYASVLFTGSLDGICTVSLEHSTAAEITANLMGIPPADVPADLLADTAGELCNMIAGSWKTAQSQSVDTAHISCPTVTREPPASRSGQGTIHRLYRFPGHQITVSLSLS